MNIIKLVHRIEQTACKALAEAGCDLTRAQLSALEAIGQNPKANQTDIVAATGIDRSTLADVVRRLLNLGLIERKRSRDDARSNVLTITKEGKRALLRTANARLEAERKVLAEFPFLKQAAAE